MGERVQRWGRQGTAVRDRGRARDKGNGGDGGQLQSFLVMVLWEAAAASEQGTLTHYHEFLLLLIIFVGTLHLNSSRTVSPLP